MIAARENCAILRRSAARPAAKNMPPAPKPG
jgi:hypothetical protein